MKQLAVNIKKIEDLTDFMKGFQKESFYLNASSAIAQVYMGYPDAQLANSIIDTINKFDENIKIIGSTTCSEICNGRLQMRSTVVSFLFFKSSHVNILEIDCSETEEVEAAGMISDFIAATDSVKNVQIVLNNSNMQHPNEILRNIVIKDKNIAVSGFGAGLPYRIGGDTFDSLFVFGSKIIESGVIVAVYSGEELHCITRFTLGWMPCGTEHEITRMLDDITVAEIDGRPAADFYSKYLGVPVDDKFLGSIFEFPIVVNRDGVYIARAVGKMDEDKNLTFPADVYEGEKIQLSFGNIEEIIKASRENSIDIAKFIPESLQVIICGNRLMYLKDEQQTELEYYQHACEDMTGCSSFGEIALIGDRVTIFNCALVATAYREGEPDMSKQVDINSELFKEKNRSTPLVDRMYHFLMTSSKEYVEQREMEKENRLEEEVRIQKAANDAKSQFLSNMSHEIRTPINAVLGMNEMILREAGDENILEYAENIKNAGTMLLGLVNDILDFSKIEAGKLEIIPVEYSLSSLINDIVILNSVKIENKGLFIDLKIDSNLPDALFGDEMRIRQVLINIISNAVKYTEEGGIYFIVKEISRTDSDVTIEFRVKDTGIGIKPEDLKKLFSAFERIEEKRNRTIEGTGLGMNIVKNLLKMMGSRLEVESVYGEGSEFCFRIEQPIVSSCPIGNFEQRSNHKDDMDSFVSEPFTAPDAHILVVDDTVMNLKVIKSLLKRTLIQIDTAESGENAIELAKDNHYDIIFMDHRMPAMDGSEAMKIIRELPEDENKNIGTPIIVLTANTVAGAREKFIEEGFDDYLSKPVNSDILEAIVRHFLKKDLIIDGKYTETQRNISENDAKRFEKLTGYKSIDVAAGIKNSGNADIYAEVLEEFVISAQDRINVILSDLMDEDIRDYTIRIHSLKSSARLVGALELSGFAAFLEKCGNENRQRDILEKTPGMLQCYQEVVDIIKEALESDEDEEEKPQIDMKMLKDAYAAIKEFVSAFDFDSADSVAATIDKYSLPAEEGEKFSKLKSLLKEVNYDGILALLV
ncbi:MAG: response regulator [Lachnospiraceae bacterium]|nr:response regulator [Lachnospiraceae bacterium]